VDWKKQSSGGEWREVECLCRHKM